MRLPPKQALFDEDDHPNTIWIDWFEKELYPQASLDRGRGTTAQRPTTLIQVGTRYFDTTLGIPIWYDGTNWIDATGATV